MINNIPVVKTEFVNSLLILLSNIYIYIFINIIE